MNWLIDFGNTNVKWSYVQESQHLLGGALKYADSTPSKLLETIIKSSPNTLQPTTILISNVGKTSFVVPFCDLLDTNYSSDVRVIESSRVLLGVKNCYDNPSQLGVDRLLAMAAAYHETGSANIVVDMGTAVTLDCIDQSGVHLGGLIVPGSELMLKSLMRESSKLNISDDLNQNEISYPLLAHNTHDAVLSGIHYMLASFIREQVKAIHKTICAGQAPSLFLTGGGSKAFRESLGADWVYEPDLVLKGLYFLLESENNQ